MTFLALLSRALVTSSLVLGSQSLPQKATRNPKSLTLGQTGCREFNDNVQGRAKELWDDSLAGPIADDFINEHGSEDWVRQLDMEVFSNDVSDSWDCYGETGVCTLDYECPGYQAVGAGGAYYIFYSIQSIRIFLNSFQDYLEESTLLQILDIPQISEDFKKKELEEDLGIFGILAAAFCMVGGLAAPIAGVAGPATFTSGLSSAIGSLPDPEGEEKDDIETKLSGQVKTAFTAARDRTKEIAYALFGKPGYDQKLIPKGMMDGQAFDNNIVNVFGGGQWLVAHPSDILEDSTDAMYHRMKQGLAWTTIKHEHQAFFYIDSDVKKERCADGEKDDPEEFWDDKVDGCVKLYSVDDSTGKDVFKAIPADIQGKLWSNDGPYNLDRKKTLHNAYDCWVKNEGKVGKAVVPSDPTDTSLPECFFGITLVRGSLDSPNLSIKPKWTIELAEFPGQKEGSLWYGKLG